MTDFDFESRDCKFFCLFGGDTNQLRLNQRGDIEQCHFNRNDVNGDIIGT